MNSGESSITDERFVWTAMAARMSAASAAQEPHLRELLLYFEPAGQFCMRLLQHANQVTEESAQKTLAVNWTIQAFRASTSAARLSLDGYADIASGLARSVWESQLRLRRIRKDGELTALAEIFASINREIILRNAVLKNEDDPATRKSLDTWKAGKADILAKALAHGGDEDHLRSLSAKSIEKLASDASLGDEYDVWYRGLSQMHHGGRAFVTYPSLVERVQEGGSVLLPVAHEAAVMTAVALEHLYRTITEAALIFGDWSLASEVQRSHLLLSLAIKRVLEDSAA